MPPTLYNDAGQKTLKAYPQCVGAACANDDPVRHQQFGWTRGFLTQVTGVASSITYHPQGLWSTIAHTNGVTDHQSVWSGQARPGRIWTTGATGGNFDTGAYQYDGVGNVKRMGHDEFGYQASGRLRYAEVACLDGGESSCHRQRYEYGGQGRGNLFWVETRPRGGAPVAVQWSVNANTNRLSSASYDVAGNMTQSPYQGQLAYDSQDALVRMGAWGENTPRQFVYTADGERVWTILGGGLQVLDVRGFDGQLLRTYTRSMPPNGWSKPWSWSGDVVWRGSQRLAQVGAAGARHYHPDHLGTPRLQTNGAGAVSKRLNVFPFGREAPGTDSASVRFTGHERDNLGTTSGVDDMDYMHARFYSPQMARFFSVDPVGGNPSNPQSWNRYTYTTNNPLKYTDPNGELAALAVAGLAWAAVETGLTIWDIIEWQKTLSDQNASLAQKAGEGALVVAGVVGPGGGYGRIADKAFDVANTFRGGRFKEVVLKPGTRVTRVFEEGVTKQRGSFLTRGATARRLASSDDAARELALTSTSGARPNRVVTFEVTESTPAKIGFIERGGDNAIQVVIDPGHARRNLRVIELKQLPE